MAAFMKLKAEDASKAIAHSQFQPETDGYMKLGDIKGEGVRNRIGIRNPMESAIKEVGWWTVDGADFRGIQQDALTKGGQEGEEARGSFGESPVLKQRSNWDVICDVGTAIKQDGIDLQSDALVQQGNDFTGLINPDSMRPADFANNQVMFETRLPVEGIGASNPMGIEPNQMMGSISRGDMFAAANELRSDNRF